MKKLEFLNGINEEFIASAESVKRKRPAWKIIVSAAAALLVVIGAALIIGGQLKKDPQSEKSAAVESDTPPAETSAPVIVTDDPALTPESVPGETQTAEPTEVTTPDPGTAYHIPGPLQPNTGVSSDGGPEYILVNGKYYKGYMSFDPEPGFLGDNIGTFVFSDKYGYTYPYDYASPDDGKYVFSLKGYDTGDMLGTIQSSGMVSVFVHDNDLNLYSGSDLFERTFHIRERMASFRYYNRNESKYFSLNGEAYEDAVALFLDAIDSGEWVELQNKNQYPFVYDVYIDLSDDFTVSLRMCRDGYVYIEHIFNGTAIKVDTDMITPLLDLIDADAGEMIKPASSFEHVLYEDLAADPIYGALVPTGMNDGFELDWSTIHYKIDFTTGRIVTTVGVEMILKDSKASYIITIGQKETLDRYGIMVYDGQPGGRYIYASDIAVPIEQFTIDDVLISSFMKEGRYDSLYAAAIIGDACIYIHAENHFENDPAEPDILYRLIESIQY